MRVYVVATIRMLIIIMAIVTYAGGTSYAQPSPLQVVLPLVDADPGQEPDSMATVNLDLFGSIVCGFDIWFSADRDDIARFTTETIIVFDTAYWKCNVADGQFCLDSTEVGWYDDWDYITIDPMERTGVVFDTVGTLLSGWEIVRVTSPSGDGSDVRIVAVADDLETPGTVSCILPTSYAPLIRLGSRALMVPDTQAVRSTYLNLPMDAAHCRFWNEHGTYIGGLPEVTPDTSYYLCDFWFPDGDSTICLSWRMVLSPPYDSLFVYPDTMWHPDPAEIFVIPGRFHVPGGPLEECGNLDGSSDAMVDIGDLTLLIDHLFINFTSLDYAWLANADGSSDGIIDVSDLTVLITYMFTGVDERRCRLHY